MMTTKKCLSLLSLVGTVLGSMAFGMRVAGKHPLVRGQIQRLALGINMSDLKSNDIGLK